MTPIEFTARGVPKGQPRPRAFVRKTSFGPIARVYDAGTAEGWKSEVALAARPILPAEPLDGPLSVVFEIWMPRPLGHFVASRRERGLKPAAPTWHTSKPDADNLAKALLDALSSLRLWQDDDQVALLSVSKRYEDPSTGPGALIRIQRPSGVVYTAAPEQPLLIAETTG